MKLYQKERITIECIETATSDMVTLIARKTKTGLKWRRKLGRYGSKDFCIICHREIYKMVVGVTAGDGKQISCETIYASTCVSMTPSCIRHTALQAFSIIM